MINLILPVAGKSSRYPNMRPKWLISLPDGKLMIEKSVENLNLKVFNKIYIVALEEHLRKHVNKKNLLISLKKNISKNIELIELKKSTFCEVETIYNAIKIKNIKGGIVIKECDNTFHYKFDKKPSNEVMFLNLRDTDLIDVKLKSYVKFDKLKKAQSIVENKVISEFFCCGAYSFKSSIDFLKYSEKLLSRSKDLKISSVINEMIVKKNFFRCKEVKNYVDWGTVREFRNWQRKYITMFCDFDGCLVFNGSKFGKNGYQTKPIVVNLRTISRILNTGFAELIITTARPHQQKKNIQSILKKFNIKPKYILTDLLHSKRVLINDFSETNPFPSSISINLERDSSKLSNILINILK